jgi:hypothetical protein
MRKQILFADADEYSRFEFNGKTYEKIGSQGHFSERRYGKVFSEWLDFSDDTVVEIIVPDPVDPEIAARFAAEAAARAQREADERAQREAVANAKSWRDLPMTVKQSDYMTSRGVVVNPRWTRGYASDIISSMVAGDGISGFSATRYDGTI